MRPPIVPTGLVGDFLVVMFQMLALLEVMVLRCLLIPTARNADAILDYELREMIMLDVFRNGLPRS